MSKVYMMVTITNRNKRKDFRTFFKEYGLPVFLETTGRGTAQSEVLDISTQSWMRQERQKPVEGL